ncbi:aspartate aminotransferase family protein [Albidovulum sp.]|jgi:alanine-glyoxylate transaminase/(R)-3-amino-2-methylpropionate-pyruvate transaminase|uniref:aspartate aminotransferase family protein n=1 Tax=Albidovulum sp. TaxID=1872424 RepID=UPI003067913A
MNHTLPNWHGSDLTEAEILEQLPPLEWDYDTAVHDREQYLSPVLKTFQATTKPILLRSGLGQYLYDAAGNRFIDTVAMNQAISAGYRSPWVMTAVKQQLDAMQHCSTMWMHPGPASLAKSLVEKMPAGDWVVHFLSSGTEAVDLAVTMARNYTGRHTVVGLRSAYHGGVGAVANALTSISRFHHKVTGASGVLHATNPDQYRGIHGAGVEPYVAEFRSLMGASTNGELAAYIFEPIQGYGGVIPLPTDYIKQTMEIARSMGGIIICDEIQTAIGRTGKHFYGFMEHGIVPDIVVMAKGLGNGFPISAVVVRRDIAEAMTSRAFMSTYGSNPTCCAAARGVMAALGPGGLQENARIVGEEALKMFRELQTRHEVIGDIRGSGMMIGVELVKDRETKAPASDLVAKIADQIADKVIVTKAGVHANVFRLVPPLCLTVEDATEVIERLDALLTKLA